MKRVFVTGMGVIVPNAMDIKEFSEALRAGKSGIGKLSCFDASELPVQIGGEVKNFIPDKYCDPKTMRRQDRFSQLGLAATEMAVKQAGLDNPSSFIPERVGVIFSSGIGGVITLIDEHKKYLEAGPNRVNPFLVPMMITNITSGIIGMLYGFTGPNFSITSACASSMHAIGEAYLKVVRGDADIMITGGSEAALLPLTYMGFAKIKALSKRNDEPEKASRPFDRDRDGFVMGEGGGALVIESEESMIKRGSTPLVEIVGYGSSADAYHLTAPHPEGIGAASAMQQALNFNSSNPQDISYINAHGTATPLGDAVEIKAIHNVFGDHARNISINSTKCMIGHLLGGAGVCGAIATILQMHEGFLHPNINLENLDEELLEMRFTGQTAENKDIKLALVNSFGFGGQNASVILKSLN
ncbi:MAG: beta-ketoacyl-ACP synthase II [Candidatus Riflebacteria bacterium]|nr:beta-ketoacyl-ACP synthase II [Candidatus Riflebacteria bacterium]